VAPVGDLEVRLAAFAWLADQTAVRGDVLPWSVLLDGFRHGGERVPLVSMQGIFTPRLCRLPLAIRTSPGGPYSDAFAPGGLLHYRYRGTDPAHRDNAGLRAAMRERVPLVYLYGHVEGRYHAVWPVFVVGDDPAALTFTVEADDARYIPEAFEALHSGSLVAEDTAEPRRRYVTAIVRRRLHQDAFRERVLSAYRESCALCRLRRRELLDAAHIAGDTDPEGEPVVTNGLALCKLHHAAFDSYLLTVHPDYRIVVRPDVLDEQDGPMLVHGLQELHGKPIRPPHRIEQHPSRELLGRRLERFEALSR
jgi:putative restriction endonuclease